MDPVWWLFSALTKMETQLYAVPQSAAVPARNIPLGGTAYISRESGKSYMSFRAKADTNSNIVLRPTLLSMQVIREISSNDVSVSQVIEFLNTSRRERRPVDKDLTTGAMQQIVTCPPDIGPRTRLCHQSALMQFPYFLAFFWPFFFFVKPFHRSAGRLWLVSTEPILIDPVTYSHVVLVLDQSD